MNYLDENLFFILKKYDKRNKTWGFSSKPLTIQNVDSDKIVIQQLRDVDFSMVGEENSKIELTLYTIDKRIVKKKFNQDGYQLYKSVLNLLIENTEKNYSIKKITPKLEEDNLIFNISNGVNKIFQCNYLIFGSPNYIYTSSNLLGNKFTIYFDIKNVNHIYKNRYFENKVQKYYLFNPKICLPKSIFNYLL